MVWRSGTSLSLYRGVSYQVPLLQLKKRMYNKNEVSSMQTLVDKSTTDLRKVAPDRNKDTALEKSESTSREKKYAERTPEVNYEDELDKILDGLGPRYEDWPGSDPPPIDADMLPGIVLGYQPPFRILPYGVRPSLGLKEATSLRRLARVLPPHFALGMHHYCDSMKPQVCLFSSCKQSLCR